MGYCRISEVLSSSFNEGLGESHGRHVLMRMSPSLPPQELQVPRGLPTYPHEGGLSGPKAGWGSALEAGRGGQFGFQRLRAPGGKREVGPLRKMARFLVHLTAGRGRTTA